MVILPTEKKIDWSRPPVVVFSLLVINLLVFLWQQSNDVRVLENSLQFYGDSELPAKEWQPYLDYRVRTENADETALRQQRQQLLPEMALDPEFDLFLQQTIPYYTNNQADAYDWNLQRQQLRQQVNQLSAKAYGLATHQFSVINLVSYQFLHGGWLHLLGNMIFLLVCGFAVEASLGGRRFLLFYVLGGVGAGLYFQLSKLSVQEQDFLVGASGSVSAVMAMYVSLFRLKKIEFFYWLFVFVGYFRAPALLLLPLYIAMELAKWWAGANDNIAYSAHIGGFITGFALVTLTQYFLKNSIDDQYLEQNQDQDQERKALDRVYRAIADYEFRRALSQLNPLLGTNKSGEVNQLRRIKLNLVTAIGEPEKSEYLLQCIEKNHHFSELDNAINDWWHNLSAEQQLALDDNQRVKVALRLLDVDQYKTCESILYQLLENNYQQPMVAKLARRLAHFYERQGIISQTTVMTELADKLMHSGMHDNRTQL